MAERKIVIYNRYSTDMQRPDSCTDQEREVRAGLQRKQIDSTNAVVIHDEAESGTKSNRDGFRRLQQMLHDGQILILAVDDQSRLSRAENAFSFVKDVVYSGGRFISTGEGIDTNDHGWELKVKVLELHHGETIRGLKDKVRRGQRGRVLADDSAGDFPFGYESFYHDADWQAQLARRGPKPKKGLQINEREADVVRRAFQAFLDGKSIAQIARALTKEGADKGRRSKTTGWHPQQVHRILSNAKYVGKWTWGETTTIRNSAGKKKQIEADPDQVTMRDRPDLRIVEQDTWDRAQARLAELAARFGYQPGQKKRGPKLPANPTDVYPRTLLGGVLECALCGSPMWFHASGGRRYYSCSGHIKGMCATGFQVPAEKAEQAVIDTLTSIVAEWPEWLVEVHDQLRNVLISGAARIPEDRERDRRRLAEVRRQLNHFIDAIAQGGHMSQTIATRVAAAEREIADLEERLAKNLMATAADLELPDEKWVRDQLADWSNGLSDRTTAAVAIREAVHRITAEPVIHPGKKRGYAQLRIEFAAWPTLLALIGGRLPPALRQLLPNDHGDRQIVTVIVPLGESSLMDRWAPEIVRWRNEGVIWEEIVRRTGMDLNRVYRAWKRYQDAKKSA